MTQWISYVGAAAVAAAMLSAQLRVDVQLVNVVATVIDEKGRHVPNLNTEDFVLEEDGQIQAISHVTSSADLPVSMGITLDTSESMVSRVRTAVVAADRIIGALQPNSDVFLMTFSDRPNLVEDFTSDRQRLTEALGAITTFGKTALYDAVFESLRLMKSGGHQKKALLLITDGRDTSQGTNSTKALQAVRESELLVYCIGIASSQSGLKLETEPPDWASTSPTKRNGIVFDRDTVDVQVLNGFADVSGGRSWLVSGASVDKEMESVVSQLVLELRSQYSIGYYPNHAAKDGKWHRIRLRAKNSRYYVRARKQYFGN
jgi:Ca-activated chloride channel homolog